MSGCIYMYVQLYLCSHKQVTTRWDFERIFRLPELEGVIHVIILFSCTNFSTEVRGMWMALRHFSFCRAESIQKAISRIQPISYSETIVRTCTYMYIHVHNYTNVYIQRHTW